MMSRSIDDRDILTITECDENMTNADDSEPENWTEVEIVDDEETECCETMTNELNNSSDEWVPVDVIDNDAENLDWLLTECDGTAEDVDDEEQFPVNENESHPERRVVDINYLFDQLQKFTNVLCKSCGGEMQFSDEFRRGLASTFFLTCINCGNRKTIASDQMRNKKRSNVNEAACLGIVSIGSGLYNLQEFCANLNIPCMSYPAFYRIDKRLQIDWWSLAKKLQDEALAAEIKIAKDLGEVDSAGNALIAVKCDGSWQTRSYGNNFKSLAGCAAIIGMKTNKIMYMDVKNRYCHVCKTAQSRCTPPNFHECNANYTGSPAGMETQIIVEGFKFCEQKGARFNKFIGDGDSSTYKQLRDLRLYKNPVVFIDKFDCMNHIDKNFGKKFRSLLTNTKFNQAGRQLLTIKMGCDITKGVRMAAIHWNGQNLTDEEKCLKLEQDCMNAPLHVFGVHDHCAEYFCKKTTKPEARDRLKILKDTGLYLEVMNLCQFYYANRAKSLLARYENNIAESYNSLIAKYLGGKRVNNALAGSYKARAAIAAVNFNTNGQTTSTFQKFKYDNPQPAIVQLEKQRKRKVIDNAIRSAQNPEKRKKKNEENQANKKKKNEYGDGREELDFTPAQLELAKKIFLDQLEQHRLNRLTTEVMTRGQRYNSKWFEVSQNLLTTFYFGRILCARNRKSYQKIVEDILYHNYMFSNTADLVHQRLHEKEALELFCNIHKNETVDVCGIFIDPKHCFIGASPFRICGQNSILVVYCPHKLYKKDIMDSINQKLLPFWTVNDGEVCVNIKSHWYIEVQGQLHVSDKRSAFVLVFLDESQYKIEEIVRDDSFWANEMEEELVFFFNEAMIKELANPRDERNMPLRMYDETTKTFI